MYDPNECCLYEQQTKNRLLKQRVITDSGCWEYTGFISPGGYGVSCLYGQRMLVHRMSLRLYKCNEYKENLDVLHKCNNRKCFNPDHLYSGNDSDNMKDSVIAGTHHMARKTHCKMGHEFTPENTKIDSKGGRNCMICYKAGYNLRNKVKNSLLRTR